MCMSFIELQWTIHSKWCKTEKKEKSDPLRASNPGRWTRSRRTKPLHYECFLEKTNDALYVISLRCIYCMYM
jgi:hypothetical protein